MTENEKAWIKEFYPIPADSKRLKTDVARLRHSLRKWIGLRAESLKKHDLTRPPITINTTSCSLCHAHVKTDKWCPGCPFYRLRNKRCDMPYCSSPWYEWSWSSNPEAKELKKAKAARK